MREASTRRGRRKQRGDDMGVAMRVEARWKVARNLPVSAPKILTSDGQASASRHDVAMLTLLHIVLISNALSAHSTARTPHLRIQREDTE